MVRKLVSQAAVEEMGKEEAPSAEGGARREASAAQQGESGSLAKARETPVGSRWSLET